MLTRLTSLGGDKVGEKTSEIRMVKEGFGDSIPSSDYNRASDSAYANDKAAHHEDQKCNEPALPFRLRLTVLRMAGACIHLRV